ncbi:MAG: ISAzo13-like element transposase-related protein [Candidatus Electrothrix sp. YB6]
MLSGQAVSFRAGACRKKQRGGFAYGLYDIYSNIGYITLGTSGDTSEFGCACIRN